jgi:hypothetical protein
MIQTSDQILKGKIKSTMLRQYSYDCKNHTLSLTFMNGKLYKFYSVPMSIIEGFIKTKSQGKYFNNIIKNNYSYELTN